MKTPHLTISKHFSSKAFFESHPEPKDVVCSIHHNCLNSPNWITSYETDLEKTLEVIWKERNKLGGTYFVVQNSAQLKRSESTLTLTLSYPLKFWVIFREEEMAQSSFEKNVAEDVWFLRFFKPHVSQILGDQAEVFFTKHVLQVAQAEQSLESFKKERRMPWRKNKRPTFFDFSVVLEDREVECPPVLAYKYQFENDCATATHVL